MKNPGSQIALIGILTYVVKVAIFHARGRRNEVQKPRRIEND